MELKFKNDGILTIYLQANLDSTNAQETGQEIDKIISENRFEKLVLDCQYLEYISSAGLRIVLKLLKSNLQLQIINVNLVCYEVLEMTGFTKLVDVKKAYRQFDVSHSRVIGEGAKGIVYRYNDDTIIKVYKNNDVLDEIERERELSKEAFVSGIPTAISYDVIKVGDNFGSLFELLDCHSLSELINLNSDKLEEYGKKFADLLTLIHSTESDNPLIGDGKSKLNTWLENSRSELSLSTHDKIAKWIDEIPETNKLIHGDFHTKNIMVQDGEFLLIDMDTLAHADPIVELAIIDFSLYTYNLLDATNVEKFLNINASDAFKLYDVFVNNYFQGLSPKQVENNLKKIRILSNLRALNHQKKRDNNLEIINKATQTIEQYVNEVDNLILEK